MCSIRHRAALRRTPTASISCRLESAHSVAAWVLGPRAVCGTPVSWRSVGGGRDAATAGVMGGPVSRVSGALLGCALALDSDRPRGTKGHACDARIERAE